MTKDYVIRMDKERDELCERIERLEEKLSDNEFLDSIGANSEKAFLMYTQSLIMKAYSNVLMRRIQIEIEEQENDEGNSNQQD